MDNVKAEVLSATSKAGNPYSCLQITIGDYQTRVFPSPIELKYIQSVLNK